MKNRPQLAEEARSLFSDCADAESAWTWRRIQSVRNIVALGTIAEHGILRFFDKMKAKIWINKSERPWESRFQDHDNGWTAKCAQQYRTLASWFTPGACWKFSGALLACRGRHPSICCQR
jgi:hypothetical protein